MSTPKDDSRELVFALLIVKGVDYAEGGGKYWRPVIAECRVNADDGYASLWEKLNEAARMHISEDDFDGNEFFKDELVKLCAVLEGAVEEVRDEAT